MTKILTIIITITIVMVVLILFFWGIFWVVSWLMDEVEIKEVDDKFENKWKASINKCLENGGVSIYSLWDNRLKRCDYKLE